MLVLAAASALVCACAGGRTLVLDDNPQNWRKEDLGPVVVYRSTMYGEPDYTEVFVADEAAAKALRALVPSRILGRPGADYPVWILTLAEYDAQTAAYKTNDSVMTQRAYIVEGLTGHMAVVVSHENEKR